jgi:hypothetical protein
MSLAGTDKKAVETACCILNSPLSIVHYFVRRKFSQAAPGKTMDKGELRMPVV